MWKLLLCQYVIWVFRVLERLANLSTGFLVPILWFVFSVMRDCAAVLFEPHLPPCRGLFGSVMRDRVVILFEPHFPLSQLAWA